MPSSIPRAFIAMPFNRRFQAVYDVIRRVCERTGVESVRVDEIVAPGDIYAEIEREIEHCDFMIADLSGDLDPLHCNPNVALEVGYARRSRKPVILLTQSVATLPFDLRTQRAIEYRPDPEELDHLESRLADIVTAAVKRMRDAKLALPATSHPIGHTHGHNPGHGQPHPHPNPAIRPTTHMPYFPPTPAAHGTAVASASGPAAAEAAPGFRYLRDETFSCPTSARFLLPVFRCELFARALEFADDETDPAIEFVRIPGGEFMMGSPKQEVGRQKWEGPQRRVRIQPFLLARTPMTQAVWDAVNEMLGLGLTDQRTWRDDWLPIERVSWLDVQPFLQAAQMRLPSEAEWEFACRGGTESAYFFGDDEEQLAAFAWYDANSAGTTHEVASTTGGPNPFGLYDMLGNVCEWVADLWHPTLGSGPIDGSAWTAGTGTSRVLRGGSFSDDADECRCASRFSNIPGFRGDIIGFRPAVTLA